MLRKINGIKILVIFAITSGFYFLFILLFPERVVPEQYDLIPILLDLIMLSISFGLIWQANNRFAGKMDGLIKWEKKPFLRLIIHIGGTSLITLVILAVIMTTNGIITIILYPHILEEHTLYEYKGLFVQVFFYMTALLLLYYAIYFSGYFYKKWVRTQLEAEKLKVENLHAQLRTLQSQINPHFLFNVLNTLTSLISEDQNTAIEFVQHMANFYRHVLQMQDDHIVTLREEIKFLKHYIFLQKKRFGENLIIDIEFTEDILEKYIPTFVLLILMENAVKHNVISSEMPLRIRIYYDGEDYIAIENNLQKRISTAPSTGYGLTNIKHRYEILSDRKIITEENSVFYKIFLPLLPGERFPK
ncbi:MAG: histidine kinase [Ignavibacteria bacterium]|jgi:sensor histidine kinase YesM